MENKLTKASEPSRVSRIDLCKTNNQQRVRDEQNRLETFREHSWPANAKLIQFQANNILEVAD